MIKPGFEDQRQKLLREHQIVQNSPQERKIVQLLEESLIPNPESKKTFDDFRKILIHYYKNALNHLNDSKYIHDETQELLKKLADRGSATIVRGKEFLDSSLSQKPVFLATNHLGLYKLATINPYRDLGLTDTGVEKMYSLPLFHASNYPVAKVLGNNLYIAAFEFPGKLGEVQKKAGGVVIRLKEELEMADSPNIGGIETLAMETNRFFTKYGNAALTILPEGRTSGKQRGISPYDLEEFRTGAFVVAAMTEIPIIPVAQRFKNGRFEVAVFQPIHLSKNTERETFRKIADSTRDEMYNWLNR